MSVEHILHNKGRNVVTIEADRTLAEAADLLPHVLERLIQLTADLPAARREHQIPERSPDESASERRQYCLISLSHSGPS